MNTRCEREGGPAGLIDRRVGSLLALTLALTVVLPGFAGGGWRRAEAAPSTPPSVAVPAYFWPGPEWETLLRSGPEVKYVVLNPDSGPGTQTNSGFVDVVTRARARGFTVVGYVDTAYGARSASLVQADIAHYRAWYGVNQFFFDQTPSSCTSVGYYSALQTFVQQDPRGFVILNPGTNPGECYLAVSDMVVNFEGSESSYASWTPAPYVAAYGPEHFWHIVYGIAPANVTSILSMATQRNAGFVYLTDEGFPNPFFRIPSALLWQAQVPSNATGGRGAAPQSPGTQTSGDRPAAPQASVPPLIVSPSTDPVGDRSGVPTTNVPIAPASAAPASPAAVSGATAEPVSFPNIGPLLVPDSVPESAVAPNAVANAEQVAAPSSLVDIEEAKASQPTLATTAVPPPVPLTQLVAAPGRIVVDVLGEVIRSIELHTAPVTVKKASGVPVKLMTRAKQFKSGASQTRTHGTRQR